MDSSLNDGWLKPPVFSDLSTIDCFKGRNNGRFRMILDLEMRFCERWRGLERDCGASPVFSDYLPRLL
jgi:hypothetical protein